MKATIFLIALAALTAGFPSKRPALNPTRSFNFTCAINDINPRNGISLDVLDFLQRFTGILKGHPSDLGNSTATADAILETNFVVYSDSQASIQGQDLEKGYGETIVFLKEDYLNAEQLKKEYAGVEIWTLDFVMGCNEVVWHWQLNNYGNGKLPVRGFHSFLLEADPVVGLKALSARLEFNTIAGLLDAGGRVVHPHERLVMLPERL